MNAREYIRDGVLSVASVLSNRHGEEIRRRKTLNRRAQAVVSEIADDEYQTKRRPTAKTDRSLSPFVIKSRRQRFPLSDFAKIHGPYLPGEWADERRTSAASSKIRDPNTGSYRRRTFKGPLYNISWQWRI